MLSLKKYVIVTLFQSLFLLEQERERKETFEIIPLRCSQRVNVEKVK